MKSTHSDLYLTMSMIVIATFTVTTSLATPILYDDSLTARKEMNEILEGFKSEDDHVLPIVRGEKIGETTCLSMAPDLPPCNFDSQATWRSTSGEIFHDSSSGSIDYQSDTIAEYTADLSSENIYDGDNLEEKNTPQVSATTDTRKNLKDIESYGNDLAMTIVYYLEGCLPSRLPFDLPSCSPVAELRRIRMNKLVPFKLPNVEDALIFPDIDVKQIKFPPRRTRIRHPVYSSREEIEAAEISERRDEYRDESTGPVSLSDIFPIRTTSSSLQVKEDEGGTKKDSSDQFQRIITRKSINPMIGIAMTKYPRKLSGSGQPSSISSTSVNRHIINNIDN